MLQLRMAWRNLRRNPRRTLILVLAMTLSTAILLVTTALDQGLADDLVSRATSLFVGEVQVHAPGFRASHSLYDVVKDPAPILAAARAGGFAAAPRAIASGLLSHGTRSAGVALYGVDPAAERRVGELAGHLASGRYLPDAAAKELVIGGALARTLGAKVGDEVVIVTQAADGSIGNGLYHVGGILQPVGDDVDREMAFLDRKDFEDLLAMPDAVHEIVVTSHGTVPAEVIAAAISPAAGGNEVATWRRVVPVVDEFSRIMGGVTWMMSGLFICAAGLGVLNAMLMAQFERIPEFGLMKALGATPGRVVLDVVAESVLAGAVSVAAGAALGVAISLFLTRHGIPLGGADFTAGGFAVSPEWRAHLTGEAIGVPIVTTFFTAFVGAIYPAVRAARLDPVAALNHV